MKHIAYVSVCLAWVVLLGPTRGAAGAEEDLVDQVRKSRKELIASQISPPNDTSSGAELDEAARRVRDILNPPVRKATQPTPTPTPATPSGPASGKPAQAEKKGVPALSPEQLARLKELSTKQVPDPVGLADALFLGRHRAEADALYERILADEATPKQTKAWALFQMANCRRRRDPAAAIALYGRLATEHPQCLWIEPAKTYKTLLDWYQTAQPAAVLQPEQTAPRGQETKGRAG